MWTYNVSPILDWKFNKYKKEDIVPKKDSITLHHSSMGVTVTHEMELSDYNSMIQGYINFLRGIGMVIPEEEDRV